MDPVLWRRAEEIFHAAIARRATERRAFIDAAGGGDQALVSLVDALLRHAEAEAPLDRSALEMAALGQTSVAHPTPSTSRPIQAGDRIAQYRIVRRLGEGGMGVVFEADDERLGRRVALKVLRDDTTDPAARERLAREARLAAQIVDARICQVYDLGIDASPPFIAMELVHGEPLSARLANGPLPPTDAIHTALEMLEALRVLHGHGIVHRDLKPSNVFLAPTGIKLLDFGVARPVARAGPDATEASLTSPGMFIGTPRYASPEQLACARVDERSDLFSAAVITFEMLAGRPPFTGSTLAALAHAVMYEAPPVLTGSPATTVVDRVLHRALAKQPADRYPTAAALAAELAGVLTLVRPDQTVEARQVVRLAVLPFRVLKPDPAIDYLGPSLADALTAALAGLESLVVRSTLKAARVLGPPLDLDRVATELAVDAVLTGSLLASGSRVRVSVELVAVPSGDVLWSRVTEVPDDGVLALHDDLAQHVLEALPVSARDRGASRPRAATEKAFELYLRGMQVRAEAGAWRQAHRWFVQSLDSDPGFAEAWAERGRMERVIGKFEDPTWLALAEASLDRALALDPDSGAAQYYFAQLDVDLGRVAAALSRLLARAWQRRAEPTIFAGLVHACRYGGLLDASAAAHRIAARLDPKVATSILHTWYHDGAFDRALDEMHRSSDPFEARLLGAMGRRAEAIDAARREEARFASAPLLSAFASAMRAGLEGRAAEAVAALGRYDSAAFTDGEALFYVAEIYSEIGEHDRAMAMLHRAVAGGFVCGRAFDQNVYLAPLRGQLAWPPLLARVREGEATVVRAFDSGRGRALLDV